MVGPDSGLRRCGLVQFLFEPSLEGVEGLLIRPGHTLRGHRSRSEFPHDPFPDLGVCTHRRLGQIDCLEIETGGPNPAAMACHAVLGEHLPMTRRGRRRA